MRISAAISIRSRLDWANHRRQQSSEEAGGGDKMSNHFGGRVLLALALVAMWPADSLAQAITRQITLVVPYSAGGGTDTVARLIGNQMSRSLGQPVVIENVVGAGGTRANRARRPLRARWRDGLDQSCRAARGAQPLHQSALRHGHGLRCRRPRQQRADAAGRAQVDSRARPRSNISTGSSRRERLPISPMAASAPTAISAAS